LKRTAVVGIVAALAVATAAVGWWKYGSPERKRPNVLIVTIDTLRADHVGAYGSQTARTPTLDRLAKEGLRVADAVAQAPITMPSHASLFTGLYPPAHGVRDNGTAALPDSVVTLAERLSGAGYTTRAFVSAVVLSRLYGLDAGFGGYDDDLWAEDAPRMFMIRERPARRTADRFLDWFNSWKADRRAPFFAWVHFFDPHQPLEPELEDRVGAESLYDAEVTGADRATGRVIDALREAGVLDDTIVIVTADHGESLGEHGEATHAIFVYDATVRVPLIVRYPGVLPAGRVYEGPVRLVDVMPTLLGWLGLPGSDQTQGVDLGAAWKGSTPPPLLAQYTESLLSELGFGMAPLHAIRKDGFKWIRAPRAELYDLRADPGERTNLHPSKDARLTGIAAELDKELEATLQASAPRGQARENPMTRETLETLQSLGYLAPGAVRRSMAGVDPKDGIATYNRLEEARHAGQERNWPKAESIAREILATLPDHVAARNVLGLAQVRQRKYDEARETYQRSLQTEADQFRIHANLGSLALRARDLDGSEKEFTVALNQNPRFVEAMLNLGLIASLRGNRAGAEEWYRKADQVDPGLPSTARRFGDLYYEEGDFKQALAEYERALKLSPRLFPALVQAGSSARRVGDPARAAAYFEKAAALRVDSWVPWYNLACLRATQGEVDAAFRALDESKKRGLRDRELIQGDPDLTALRGDPRFASFVQ
jgi:arylsulfatase A-like enzyme/Tfp pilus assembly protein PilF